MDQNAARRLKISSGGVPKHARCQKIWGDAEEISLVGNILNFYRVCLRTNEVIQKTKLGGAVQLPPSSAALCIGPLMRRTAKCYCGGPQRAIAADRKGLLWRTAKGYCGGPQRVNV